MSLKRMGWVRCASLIGCMLLTGCPPPDSGPADDAGVDSGAPEPHALMGQWGLAESAPRPYAPCAASYTISSEGRINGSATRSWKYDGAKGEVFEILEEGLCGVTSNTFPGVLEEGWLLLDVSARRDGASGASGVVGTWHYARRHHSAKCGGAGTFTWDTTESLTFEADGHYSLVWQDNATTTRESGEYRLVSTDDRIARFELEPQARICAIWNGDPCSSVPELTPYARILIDYTRLLGCAYQKQ